MRRHFPLSIKLTIGRRKQKGDLMMLNQEGQVSRRDEADHQGNQNPYQREA